MEIKRLRALFKWRRRVSHLLTSLLWTSHEQRRVLLMMMIIIKTMMMMMPSVLPILSQIQSPLGWVLHFTISFLMAPVGWE